MGYTRYWHRTEKPITQEFVDAVNNIIAESRKKGITIRNGLGEGEPIVTLDKVLFNGDGEHELDHETCGFTNTEPGFNFCKTARKPYDYTVREVLKVAEKMGIITDVTEDGDNEEIISDEEYIRQYINPRYGKH